MNRDDIIRMAREAGLLDGPVFAQGLERFAYFVAAAEREACANECEHTALRMGSEWMAQHCATAIRARGQA